MSNHLVLKIGGHDIADRIFLNELASIIQKMRQPVVIVHGGGAEISTLQTQLNITPRYEEGVRVTDTDSLAIVQMILCGVVNKRLVHHLSSAGVDALGMSGADRQLITAHKMPHPTLDMGATGEVQTVRAQVIHDLLLQGITPVIAPICHGETTLYNVNADHVAGAIASATQAERIIFLTNVAGVLADGHVLPHLTTDQAQTLISDGTITGGMIPKVRTALQALAQGIPQATITNLSGLHQHTGTTFTQSNPQEIAP